MTRLYDAADAIHARYKSGEINRDSAITELLGSMSGISYAGASEMLRHPLNPSARYRQAVEAAEAEFGGYLR